MKTLLLYALTALAEIAGCYWAWLWAKQQGSVWWLLPSALSLAVFAWLLTLHEAASGRVYAAYGIRPSAWDLAGAGVALVGMGIIAYQPR